MFAEVSIFVLLSVLLAVLNIINFSMAAEDADLVTNSIKEQSGQFEKFNDRSDDKKFGFDRFDKNDHVGPLGPGSPEMNKSLRYFTISFDEEDNASVVSYHISAVTEEEAKEWAESLIGSEKTGWTQMSYRYRIYKKDGIRYVTVIDQGRELLPLFRVLMISIIGELIVLVLSFIALRFVGKSLFRPLQEADRKQKQFIRSVESDFKIPLTIINANTVVMERENGPSEETNSINRQIRKMSRLVKELGVLGIVEEEDLSKTDLDLSEMLAVVIDSRKELADKLGVNIELNADPDIHIMADEESLRKMLIELVENSIKYSEGQAEFRLSGQNGRIVLIQKNKATLSPGNVDQAFDRFTRLSNSDGKEGSGLGLSYVKEIVKLLGGRCSANVSGEEFILKIDF